MKKFISLILISLFVCTMCSCGKSSGGQALNGIDVDLTKLSSTMVYSEVYNMMAYPDKYVGKTVRMKGQFALYENSKSGTRYFACIIADATACCSQGLEFVPESNSAYPALGTEITVTGEFSTYEEDGNIYCHLIGAKFN